MLNSMLVNLYSQNLTTWLEEVKGMESVAFNFEAAFSNVNFGTSLIVKSKIVQDSNEGFQNSLTYNYYADKTKGFAYVEGVQGYSVIVFTFAFLVFLSDLGNTLKKTLRNNLGLDQYVQGALSSSVNLVMAGYCLYMLLLRGESGKRAPDLYKFNWNTPANTASRIESYEFQT